MLWHGTWRPATCDGQYPDRTWIVNWVGKTMLWHRLTQHVESWSDVALIFALMLGSFFAGCCFSPISGGLGAVAVPFGLAVIIVSLVSHAKIRHFSTAAGVVVCAAIAWSYLAEVANWIMGDGPPRGLDSLLVGVFTCGIALAAGVLYNLYRKPPTWECRKCGYLFGRELVGVCPECDEPHHCHKCGYNLSGNESGVCPECGTPIDESCYS